MRVILLFYCSLYTSSIMNKSQGVFLYAKLVLKVNAMSQWKRNQKYCVDVHSGSNLTFVFMPVHVSHENRLLASSCLSVCPHV